MSAQWWRDLVDSMSPSTAELRELRETVNRMGREKLALERKVGNLRRQLTAASGAREARVGPDGMSYSKPVRTLPSFGSLEEMVAEARRERGMDQHKALGVPPVEPVTKLYRTGSFQRYHPQGHEKRATAAGPAPTWDQAMDAATGEDKP